MSNSLLDYLIKNGNKSGVFQSAPQGLSQLKQSLEGVSGETEKPGMSRLVTTENLLSGVSSHVNAGGDISSLGQFTNVLGKTGQVGGSSGSIANLNAAQVSAAVGPDGVANAMGPVVSLLTALKAAK